MQVRYQAALRPEGAKYIRPEPRRSAQQLERPPQFVAHGREVDAARLRRVDRHRLGRGLRRRDRAKPTVLHAVAEAVARAADREPLFVQQLADPPHQQHLVMLVIAPVAAPLHRTQLREFLFPVAQHVRLDPAQLADLADREIALGRNRRQRRLRFGLVLHARPCWMGSVDASWGSRQWPASSICVLSFWLAWKVTTRRAEIGISSPVLGLRPGRWGLSRSWKFPKPESLTDSPRSRASRISSKKVSTMSLASRLFRPTCSKSISASSALVSVKVSSAGGSMGVGSSGSFRDRPRSIRPASEASLTGSDMGIGYRCYPQDWLRSSAGGHRSGRPGEPRSLRPRWRLRRRSKSCEYLASKSGRQGFFPYFPNPYRDIHQTAERVLRSRQRPSRRAQVRSRRRSDRPVSSRRSPARCRARPAESAIPARTQARPRPAAARARLRRGPARGRVRSAPSGRDGVRRSSRSAGRPGGSGHCGRGGGPGGFRPRSAAARP